MYVVLSLTGKLIGQTSHQRTSLTLTRSRGMNDDQKYNYTVADGEVIEHNTTRHDSPTAQYVQLMPRRLNATDQTLGFLGFAGVSVSHKYIYL